MKPVNTPAPAPRVALVSGFWGQNVGNAFFNIGGKWILQQVFGTDTVAFIQDQPGYRTFHNQLNGNPKNDIEYIRLLDLDWLVMQGPVLTAGSRHLWENTLKALKERGTRFLYLGAAFFKFTDEELKAAKSFLADYPPALISTRDSRSYEVLKSWNLGVPLYDGLDSAFFAPKAYTPFRIASAPYYAFNFDRFPEPTIRLGVADQRADATFEADGETWSLSIPRLVSWFAHRSKSQAYLGHLMDRRRLPTMLNGRMIIRPEHRTNPHMTYKIYQHPNAVCSDEPWTYFTVYANAALTLADRVHACVATLAYGNPAMLFTPSPRAALFERVGCGDIRSRPVCVDPAWLDEERARLVAWLRAQV